MKSPTILHYIVLTTLCLMSGGCGKQAPSAKDPSTVDEATPATTQSTEPTAPGAGVDVGMQFEDKGESNKADRTPPPTPAYKPSNKGKAPAATP